jgi:hypothetical protein
MGQPESKDSFFLVFLFLLTKFFGNIMVGWKLVQPLNHSSIGGGLSLKRYFLVKQDIPEESAGSF